MSENFYSNLLEVVNPINIIRYLHNSHIREKSERNQLRFSREGAWDYKCTGAITPAREINAIFDKWRYEHAVERVAERKNRFIDNIFETIGFHKEGIRFV